MRTPPLNNLLNGLLAVGFVLLLITDAERALGLAAVLVIALVINIAVHEVGHALVGFLVGHRVLAIVTGLGPRLLSFRALGADIEWRLFPGGGYTVLAAGTAVGKTLRFRYAAAVAAGPAASVLVALLAPVLIPADLGAWQVMNGQVVGASLASATRNMAIWLTITNLFPRPLGTDGSKLLAMMKHSDADIEQLGRTLDSTESAYRYQEGDYEAAIAASADAESGTDKAMLHTAALCQAGQWSAARDALEREMTNERLTERQRALAANNLAWALVHLTDEPGALAKADVWSDLAYAEMAEHAAVRSTRGRVLMEAGRYQEALDVLDDPAGYADLDPASRAQVHATRALAQLGRNNPFDARADADQAWRMDGNNAFVRRAYLAADEGSVRLMVSQVHRTDAGIALSEAMTGPAGDGLRTAARRWLGGVEPSVAVAVLRDAGWPATADDGTVYADAGALLGLSLPTP